MVKDKLIFALDVPTRDEALALVEQLHEHVGVFKIGLQLFTAVGPAIIREVMATGAKVFYDSKFHDIPNTVAGAAAEAAKLGLFMFNVHAAGGWKMMAAAAQAAAAVSPSNRPLILGVTVLTSLDEEALKQELQVEAPLAAHVLHLAQLAQQAGLDGVVASPQEIGLVREACGPGFLMVTPGVRPAWAAADDQARLTTPAEALRAGADYLVIGRPIRAAPDPAAAAQRILEEMAGAMDGV